MFRIKIKSKQLISYQFAIKVKKGSPKIRKKHLSSNYRHKSNIFNRHSLENFLDSSVIEN